jgi:hypothetical protein
MQSIEVGMLNLMIFLGFGAVWLAIRSNTSADWLSGIGLLLVASALTTLIARVRQLAATKAEKV